MTAPALQVRTECVAVQATVTLTGELDLDGAPALRGAFSDCFARHPRRLLLDLWDLRFCDCAGLNVLLEAEASARSLDVELRVTGVRPQVARLFTLAGVEEAFSVEGQHLPPRTV